MNRRWVQDYLSLAERVGAAPNDSDEERLQKTLLTASSPALIAAGAIWGLIYAFFGEPVAGAIPLGYAVFSTLSLFLFWRLKSYRFYRSVQLLLILLLPFFLQIALGGFFNSSAVVLWSLICPMCALVFAGPRQAVQWFVAYLAFVASSGILENHLRTSNNLPPGLILALFVLNIGAISAIVFFLLYYFIGLKNVAFRLLRTEEEKSENLLLNILPKEIAQILKNQSGTIADNYDEVSILFADIVNFTPLSSKLSPKAMVELLNEIFTHFDTLVDEFGVEKIETVGDEYMAACGVPSRCPDHAKALARLALSMCAYMANRPATDGRRLEIRIGIHSGPIVAGVIGRKKFAFELFGDTVNTANRMQSHGVPGRIQISRATYELVQDEFLCEPRGQVMIKGKGEMETWFLIGPRSIPGIVEVGSKRSVVT